MNKLTKDEVDKLLKKYKNLKGLDQLLFFMKIFGTTKEEVLKNIKGSKNEKK